MSPTDPTLPSPLIDLADAVDAVRAQLITAAARGNGSAVQFQVGDVELEFTVELRRDTTAGGRVKAWVVDAGADRAHGSTSTHRVALTLRPQDPRTGGSWLVGHDDLGDTSDFGRTHPGPDLP
ncbi:trypco2 family protein [Streptomyces tsukubensis]|uniref:trypco2 family protein n=1 Tax=Streptomyces tsukubensis TaxID=83656 RepID=UPI00344EEFD5